MAGTIANDAACGNHDLERHATRLQERRVKARASAAASASATGKDVSVRVARALEDEQSVGEELFSRLAALDFAMALSRLKEAHRIWRLGLNFDAFDDSASDVRD